MWFLKPTSLETGIQIMINPIQIYSCYAIARHRPAVVCLLIIALCSCGRPCGQNNSLELSFRDKLSQEHIDALNCISNETISTGGEPLCYTLIIQGKSIGERSIDQFSFETQDDYLSSMSWSEGPYSFDDFGRVLNILIVNLVNSKWEGTQEARRRLDNVYYEPSRYNTSFRDLSFAVHANDVRVYVRTVFSYQADRPFIIRYEVAR